MTEEWRPIPGYEGHYDVSDLGRVRSWKPWRFSEPIPRVLNLAPERDGYLTVSLSLQGVRTTWKVHVLVTAAFFGPRPDELVTRHLDADRANNVLENLAYGTPAENSRDRIEHGNGAKPGTHCRRGHVMVPSSSGWCRECKNESARRLSRERKLAGDVSRV